MSIINGAHAIVYSTDPEADRAFFRDVLELPHVDTGGGWLIFALPPSEVAVHPTETSGKHELYLTVESIEEFIERMRERAIECSEARDEGWGVLTRVSLPGGDTLGVYEPRHARPGAQRSSQTKL